jgi:serpin B
MLARIAGCLLLVLAGARAAAEEVAAVTQTDSTFATHLYAELQETPGNLFFSPASVRIALAMTSAGARGPTAAEMLHTLMIPEGAAPHQAYEALLRAWNHLPTGEGEPRAVLRVVNRLWVQLDTTLSEPFKQLASDRYGAPVGRVDFREQAEKARAAINAWVSEQTEKKIPQLLGPGTVTPASRLVLTNAIYFKAPWREPFAPSDTERAPFFLASGKPVSAALMRQTGHFRLGRFEGGKILELPYGGGLVMDVVLPEAPRGLPALEKQLARALPGWLTHLTMTRVAVALPKWKARSSFSLGEELKRMGMKQAFQFPGADFSGIDGTQLLFIGLVIHEAFVDVDENGTEAAAATAVAMLAGGPPHAEPDPVPFRADHPFLFLIRDPAHNVTLFMGRVVDPTPG